MNRWLSLFSTIVLPLLAMTACDQPQMQDQRKYEPYESAPGWPDDQSARQPPAGTVAREDTFDSVPETLPMPLSRELLARGRERFNIYCSMCHGLGGHGNGIVVQRGFPAPPSYHNKRLRQVPLRYFYNVITDGFGVMYSYADRVSPEDRWAIAAYIRALQLSQHARPEDLSPAQRARLESRP